MRNAPAIESLYQLETPSDVGPKFRLGLGDLRTEATVDLRPLNDAECVSPVREIAAIIREIA
jgi:hypothetical protein